VSLWRPESLRRRQRIAWGVDAHRLAWRSAGEGGAPQSAVHADALAPALAQLPTGASVDLIAGNDIAVHWLQTPPASVTSLDELRLVAAARCAHLYGGSPQDWWIAAEWNATNPFVCAAVPHAVTAPLREKLADAGVHARWHTGWGVACTDRANTFPAEGWSALRSPTRMLLWHCRQGRINSLGSQSVSPDMTDHDGAAQALQQARLEALRDTSLSDGPVHWVTLAATPGAEPTEANAALALGALLEGAAP
jgi:hypothetical protein